MANYSLVVNSKFRPFSYQEMLHPVQTYTQAYQGIEDEYSQLSSKASVWENMANQQTDPKAYSMYKSYAEELQKNVDSLFESGLTSGSRKKMLDLKNRYSSDIVPIEQAYNRRRQLADEQRKLLSQDNSIMYDRNAASISLDELIANPELSYKQYSGNTLAKQVGTMASSLSKQMRENPRQWKEILYSSIGDQKVAQYFETMMQRGYTPEEILTNDDTVLNAIVSQAVNSSGVASWNDKNILNRAVQYAKQGLWSAVGDTQYQQLNNQAFAIQARQYEEAQKEARKVATTKKEILEADRFGPSIVKGYEGEVNKENAILLNSRNNGNTMVTPKMDELSKEFISLSKKLGSYSDEFIQKADNHRNGNNIGGGTLATSGTSSIAGAMNKSISNPPPKGYNDYIKEKSRYEELQKAISTESDYIKERIAETEYLNQGSVQDNWNTYYSLLDAQEKEAEIMYPLALKQENYNKVRSAILNTINTTPQSVKITNKKTGKEVSDKVKEQMLDPEEINNLYLGVEAGRNSGIVTTYKGEQYTIKGINEVDNYNKEINAANSALRNFTSDITNSERMNIVDRKVLEYIVNNGNTGMDNTEIPIKKQNIPNTNLSIATLSDGNGEFVNVLFKNTPQGVVTIGINTLADETHGKAQNRNAIIKNLANSGLTRLPGLLMTDM